MAADWDEVKRLAADFQRAQLSTTVQRLSERNCIEIVNKLIELKLLEVYFTTDGKEYVTPEHLLKEIKDELFVQGGRSHLSELSQILAIDYGQVEVKATQWTKTDKNVYLILGQLIDRDYLDRLFEDVNEKLQQDGLITVGELAKQHDLPPDFLQQMLRGRLGTIVEGQTDPSEPNVVFTRAFIARHKARIRGCLVASTKPIQVHVIIQRYGLQERLFFSVVNELLATRQLMGTITGGRNERTASFIPNVYAKAQNDWVDSFYKQNHYLEYDALTRLGIGDPQGFIRKRFKTEQMTFLETCAVNKSLLEQVEIAMEEAILTDFWVDVALLCPSFFSQNDVLQVLQSIMKNSKQYNDTTLLCNTILISNKYIQNLITPFQTIMATKADQVCLKDFVLNESGTDSKGGKCKHQLESKKDRKDERRKKAAVGKSGGGNQGRETKTKSIRKKYLKGSKVSDESDDEENSVTVSKSRGDFGGPVGRRLGEIHFLTTREIRDVLKKQPLTEECSEDMLNELSNFLAGPLTTKFQEVARSVFLSTSASNVSLRKSHSEVQDKINGLVTNIHLFVRGIELFTGADIKLQLEKYLLKTVCSDVTNLILDYMSQENLVYSDQDLATWTFETRSKLLAKVPFEASREALGRLNNSVNGKSVNEFLETLEQIMGPNIGDIIIKKLDKKKERQYVFSNRQALLHQLNQETDPALVLHLTVLILFQTFTNCMLHASGKFVPQILNFLASHLTAEVHQVLHTYQGMVIKHLIAANDPERQTSVQVQLEQMMPSIKEIALNAKKGNSATTLSHDTT